MSLIDEIRQMQSSADANEVDRDTALRRILHPGIANHLLRMEAALLAAEELAEAADYAWRQLIAGQHHSAVKNVPADKLKDALTAYREATS